MTASASLAELTQAELAAELRHISERVRANLLMLPSIGFLLYAVISMGAVSIRGLRLNESFFGELNLGMAPAEGLATNGTLLALVVSINIALAVHQDGTEPRQRLRNTQWQLHMITIAVACSAATVTVALICWTSDQRSHSWGGSVAVSLLAVATIGMAAAIKASARSTEAVLADDYLLTEKLGRIDKSLDELPHTQLVRGWSAPVTSLACLAMGIVFGTISTMLGVVLFQAAGIRPSSADLVFLAGLASALAVGVLYAMSQYWLQRLLHPALAKGLLIGLPLGGLAVIIALSIPVLAAPGPQWVRIGFEVYLVATLALPTAGCLLETLKPGIRTMTPPRAVLARALAGKRRDIQSELLDIRSRRTRLAPSSP